MNVTHAAEAPQGQYTDVDFVARLRRDHLRAMLLGTLWLLGVLAVPTLLFLLSVPPPLELLDFWTILVFVIVIGFTARALHLLDSRGAYLRAARLYVVGLLVGMASAMLLAPEDAGVIRTVLPFLLPLITSAAGLLLSSRDALLLTGVGMVWLIPFVLSYRFALTAFLFSGVAALIARVTAGSLYEMAEYTTISYLRARERADELFENKERLRIALARQDWLNEELQKTNVALEKRAVQLQTSSEVSRQVTAILRLDELLDRVVTLIQMRFGYYFVGLWMLEEERRTVVLRSGKRRGDADVLQETIRISLDASSIVASVCRRGEPRLVSDVHQAADYHPLAALPDTRSAAILPLNVGGRILGALDIQGDAPRAFSEDERLVLQALADQLAVALRNAQLYGAEQARRQLAESLVQTGRALSSSLDLSEVPQRILVELTAVVPYRRGLVLIQEEEALRSVAARGFPADFDPARLHIPIREGDVFQQIVHSQEPVLIDDVQTSSRFRQLEGLPVDHSWLGVPLVTKGRVVGMISLTRRERAAFTADDAQMVQAFAGQAAIALENARLYAEITRFNEELEQRVQARTEELHEAYQALEKMDRNKTVFINVAAHELRTPLTVIRGYAQILQIHPLVKEDPDLRSTLEGILSGTDRLHAIVNSMLDVAKIGSQELELSRRLMYPWEIFERIRTRFEKALEARSLTLEMRGIEDLPTIEADPLLLYKAFDNLVENAIKYTPDGGRITVEGRTRSVDGDASVVEIVVRDTGVGIDPEEQELIFEKFYQTGEISLHSSGKTKFKGGGPGLGLAIARGVIEAHGGRIWVESPGYDEVACPGSSFYVWLPMT
ncbi:MAG: GAF domain-containing protein [Anaerolineae bacterium]